jgi:L-rhamnose mutarotase
MPLNLGQEAGEQAIFQFLLSPDPEFRLSGGPGTGKTFMMKHVMDNVMKEYELSMQLLGIKPKLNSVQLTATTNKAAEVLEQATGYPASTIHSFLGLKIKVNFSTGKTFVEKRTDFKTHSGVLLFVEEASMVDTQLKEFINEAMDDTCKIIYVGDRYQMAPITEDVSPVYSDITSNYFELTQPVRNAGQPALVALCDQMRQTVISGVFQPIAEVPGVIDFIDDDGLQHVLDTAYLDENVDSRILCYTNHRVGLYNEYVRDLRGYPETFTVGELLINSTNIAVGKSGLKVEEQYRVTKVNTSPQMVEITDEESLKCYSITIVKEGSQLFFEQTFLIPVKSDEKKKMMNRLKADRNWQAFYYLQNQFPDLRQKDASTVWKAQGSTFDNVIVDLPNISTCKDFMQVARMLFVSVSRPRNRIYLYGDIDPLFLI